MKNNKENKIPDYGKYMYLRHRFAVLDDNIKITIIQKNILDAITSEKKMLVRVVFNDIFKVSPDYIFKSGYYLIPDNDDIYENDYLMPSLVKGVNNSWEILKILMDDKIDNTTIDGEENYKYPGIYKHFKGNDYCVYTKAIGEGKIPYFVYTRMNEDEPQIYCRNMFDFMYAGTDILEREENTTGQRERFKLISTFENE